jgi:hypothetical protein
MTRLTVTLRDLQILVDELHQQKEIPYHLKIREVGGMPIVELLGVGKVFAPEFALKIGADRDSGDLLITWEAKSPLAAIAKGLTWGASGTGLWQDGHFYRIESAHRVRVKLSKIPIKTWGLLGDHFQVTEASWQGGALRLVGEMKK